MLCGPLNAFPEKASKKPRLSAEWNYREDRAWAGYVTKRAADLGSRDSLCGLGAVGAPANKAQNDVENRQYAIGNKADDCLLSATHGRCTKNEDDMHIDQYEEDIRETLELLPESRRHVLLDELE